MTLIIAIAVIVALAFVAVALVSGATRNRQDQAKHVAVIDQNETVRILEAIELASATTDRTIRDQLTLIHTLVNSNLSASLRGELAAMVKEAISAREVLRLNEEAGRPPTEEALLALKAADVAIAEKRAALADRLEATEKAEQATG